MGTSTNGDGVAARSGRLSSSWREEAFARIAELETTLTTVTVDREDNDRVAQALKVSISGHLEAAKKAAVGSPKTRFSGAAVSRVTSNMQAAEAGLLCLGSDEYLRGALPALEARVRENLGARDPRRLAVHEIVRNAGRGDLNQVKRGALVAALREANTEARRRVTRVRSFRNLLVVAAVVLAAGAVAIAIVGGAHGTAAPVCFNPEGKVVCPTRETKVADGAKIDDVIKKTAQRGDLALVELVGLAGAALAAVFALRGIKGTSTPFALPVALAILKLPCGALTALLGLFLMRGEFVPGLSALDSSGQILAWAVVFGYAQELFTKMVDARAQTVLEAVGGKSVHDAGLTDQSELP